VRTLSVSRATVRKVVRGPLTEFKYERGVQPSPAQIPIAPAARPHVPLSAVSFLGGFRTPAAEYAALSLKRPASETLNK
jgi:hypothetical protein